MNISYRRFREFAALVSAGDTEPAVAMLDESFVWQMHDSGGFEFDRNDLTALAEFVTTEMGTAVWQTDLLESRGERWMMAKLIATQVESQFRSEWIIVGELAPSGLVSRAVRFDGDNETDAAKLLAEWATQPDT